MFGHIIFKVWISGCGRKDDIQRPPAKPPTVVDPRAVLALVPRLIPLATTSQNTPGKALGQND